MRPNTNACTIRGYNLNDQGAVSAAPGLASPYETGADMRHGTRFPQERKPEEATETLFGPAPEPPPQLSADQKLTKRNADLLASGKHPATLLALLGGGATCGGCAHHHTLSHHTRTYHKCDEHRLGITHSTASDVRVSWPACTKYEVG